MNTETLRDVPVELRRQPPAAALAWVERAIGAGARVVRVRRLRNSWASAMHEVRVEHSGHTETLVLRRYVRKEYPPDQGVVENEARVLTMLEKEPLPTPQLVACDPEGDACDAPALLMTHLPGHDQLAPDDLDRYLDDLVATLHAVHAVPDPGDQLGFFFPYNLDDVTKPPPWSNEPEAWERAIEVAHCDIPDVRAGFCHRDFWPGNMLWRRGRVSGVVDWTDACRGPEAADVAHCRINLAQLFGIDVADEFARRYGPVEELIWFDLSNAVGMGNHAPEAWRWHDAGRKDLTEGRLIAALDAFVVRAVNRLE